MRTATDRVDVLLQLLDAGIPLANIVGLQIFILQEEWNKLPYGSRLPLVPLKSANKIRFINLDEIFHSGVYALQNIYGRGVALQNYFILKFCMNQGVTLISSDDAIIKVAKELRITVRKPEPFTLDLQMILREQKSQEIQIVKKNREDMSA